MKKIATDVGILTLLYDLQLRTAVATLGSAQGNVRPSAWLRTCGSGPWTSGRVTFGPTPKNENENENEPTESQH